tara:strand:+ start:62 stop:325 length:264 start_codon:yes stop_codon:yes gene_type:complete
MVVVLVGDMLILVILNQIVPHEVQLQQVVVDQELIMVQWNQELIVILGFQPHKRKEEMVVIHQVLMEEVVVVLLVILLEILVVMELE